MKFNVCRLEGADNVSYACLFGAAVLDCGVLFCSLLNLVIFLLGHGRGFQLFALASVHSPGATVKLRLSICRRMVEGRTLFRKLFYNYDT